MSIVDALEATNQNESQRHRNQLNLLCQAWMSERIAPELLPYPHTLMDQITSALHHQILHIESAEPSDTEANFYLIVLQSELERLKWLMRSFLRTRIHKIDRFSYHYMKDPVLLTRLSALEKQYAEKHQAILEKHFDTTFMKDLPASGGLRKFDDDAAAGMSMVDMPDHKRSVFCKVIGPVTEHMQSGTEAVELELDNVLLINYDAIRKLVYDVMLARFSESHLLTCQQAVLLI